MGHRKGLNPGHVLSRVHFGRRRIDLSAGHPQQKSNEIEESAGDQRRGRKGEEKTDRHQHDPGEKSEARKQDHAEAEKADVDHSIYTNGVRHSQGVLKVSGLRAFLSLTFLLSRAVPSPLNVASLALL
jgi:hypothetical protein